MRAVTQQAFGGPEVLEISEVPTPTAIPTEVLVRTRAVGLNPVEGIVRAGIFALLGQPPFILGWDVAGVVEAAVPGTNRFQAGDEVFGMPFFPRPAGAYAEFVAAPARQLARKPANIGFAEAAALPMAGLTAWQSLVDVADVQPGQRVLIHGAGGGVGHLAVQIAKARGAEVIGTASAAKHGFLGGLGVDQAIDYRSVDFSQAVRDVDVVFDLIGGEYGYRSLSVLREGGLIVTAIDRGNAELAARTRELGKRFAGISVEPDQVGLEQLVTLVEQGKLVPHLDRVLPFEEVTKAHALLDEGGAQGKIVLAL
jgi:NADPH:quinone reductase-like Zn-dependent oxidoreductase